MIHKGRVVSTNRVHEIDKTTLVGMMIEDPHRERYPRLSLRPGGTIMEVRELSSEPILHSVSFSTAQTGDFGNYRSHGLREDSLEQLPIRPGSL